MRKVMIATVLMVLPAVAKAANHWGDYIDQQYEDSGAVGASSPNWFLPLFFGIVFWACGNNWWVDSQKDGVLKTFTKWGVNTTAVIGTIAWLGSLGY